MAHAIQMPKFGQATEEGRIVRWLKNEGDPVAKGDVLFETETDKSVMEVESFFEGTLLRILASEGEAVPVNSTVGFIGVPGEELPAVPAPPAPKPVEKPGSPVRAPKTAAPILASAGPAAAAVPLGPVPAVALETARTFAISPRARKRAELAVVDYTRIPGSGPGGRVVERDVAAYLEQCHYDSVRISPAAKVLAAQEGLDILSLCGTGDGGKILVADVEGAVAERPKAMSTMRQIIAQRLTQSFTTTPHFFVTVSVDMTDLQAYREELKSRGVKYSVTDFINQALVLSLQEFPAVNSTTDGQSVWWHSHVHLGVAVALDRGLMVPVIRCAETLSLGELRDAAKSLVTRARDGKLGPHEIQGSTFTISNMGMMNVEDFTAIINPGESAILAVSSALDTPVVRGGKVAIRSMMKMTLSSDHRIIDGAMAARFTNSIKDKLEDIDLWKRLT